jgi:hypothetical protein
VACDRAWPRATGRRSRILMGALTDVDPSSGVAWARASWDLPPRLRPRFDPIPRRSSCVTSPDSGWAAARARRRRDHCAAAWRGRCDAPCRLRRAGLCYGRTRSADTPPIRLPVGGPIDRYHLQTWAAPLHAHAPIREDDIAAARSRQGYDPAQDSHIRRLGLIRTDKQYIHIGQYTTRVHLKRNADFSSLQRFLFLCTNGQITDTRAWFHLTRDGRPLYRSTHI